MSGAIEDLAKKWISEPTYQKVFKHTADVVEDYLCYILVALGAIALSVRFLSSMGSGEAICMIHGLKDSSNGTKYEDLGPYPSGATLSIINYANFNQNCVDKAMTPFMQYLPFILFIEAVIVIIIEKMLMNFPRVSQKIERFYGLIVEESLFGKDPDVAEDVQDLRANSEAIARYRRRQEVCMGLKRSNIIFTMYVVKNFSELILLLVFIPFNVSMALNSEVNLHPAICVLQLSEIRELGLRQGEIYLQCEGKKIQFFLNLLYIQISVLIAVFFCSCASLIWVMFFRNISVLLKKIDRYRVDWDIDLETTQGKDFLFLFDMLAHTSGIESTLRVLTHADETFRKICLPKLRNDSAHIKVEEDKVKVMWNPASLENWLETNQHKDIEVDSYDVTIYPTESVNNTVTKMKKDKDDSSGLYSAWFFDLSGGKTEYVITIATVIGKSRMKGERIVTTLLPFGPEKPRAGIVKTIQTNEVEISWEPPKGGFTKYVLAVDPNVTSTKYINTNTLRLQNGIMNPNFYVNGYIAQSSVDLMNQLTVNKDYTERELSSLITEYKISGLSPGETYGIELKTKTGTRFTRKPVYETVMTKPEVVHSFTVGHVTATAGVITWVAPEGHKRLKAFNILLVSHDQKLRRELAVKHNPDTAVNTFLVNNIIPATLYSVKITSVCVFEILKTVSDEETVKFSTLPESPTNLHLDTRSPNNLTVKWDPPTSTYSSHRFKLSIEASSISYTAEYSVPGDKGAFNFSKLPEITGTGDITK